MHTIDLIRSTRIEKVVQESSTIRSFYFRDDESLSSLAGQFAMVWLPGVGEFPMSLSLRSRSGLVSIGVKAMGEGSKKLYECGEKEIIGVRGPYGNSFNLSKKMNRVLLVGGGTGMVPMVLLAGELAKRRVRTSMVIGAKTREELPFLKMSTKLLGDRSVFPSTDDGTLGFRGPATEQAEEILKKGKFDQVFSCGPEKMMFSLHSIARKHRVPVQFSLERIMKCGMGICGSCTLGDLVLCRDGPVLDDDNLKRVENEFGFFERNKSGSLVTK